MSTHQKLFWGLDSTADPLQWQRIRAPVLVVLSLRAEIQDHVQTPQEFYRSKVSCLDRALDMHSRS